MTDTTASVTTIRARAEAAKAQHQQFVVCCCCGNVWPCETATLADDVLAMIAILEAADRLADAVAEPWHSIGETIKPVYPTAAAWQEYREARNTALISRAAQGGE